MTTLRQILALSHHKFLTKTDEEYHVQSLKVFDKNQSLTDALLIIKNSEE